MALVPKHSVAICVGSVSVKVFFSRHPDIDVVADIEKLALHEGIEVYRFLHEMGQPWTIMASPVYDIKAVGFEIETILHQHGISNIVIELGIGQDRQIVETLKGLF